MANKLYKKVCENCGVSFEHRTSQKKYCPECTAVKHRESNRKAMRKKREKSKSRYIPLNRFLYLLEKYNAEHKTQYTYGQFVQAIKCGEISKEDLK